MDQLGLNFQSDTPSSVTSDDGEPQVFSVSKLNKLIRGTLESQFQLIWLQAEISNFKAHTSGHWYFSLKDSKSQVSAVMFRGHNSRLKFRPENGMEVLIRGKVTVYEPRGNYQVFCETIEPVGAGALQKQFEQLKEKLKKEGLFDKKIKKPLPRFPKHVAVVTSPTGAAIRDILHVIDRRFRGLRVTVVPTIVQGASAAPQIVVALEKVSRLKDVDAVIVGRGGGSMEDLWCFNDERLARAIHACPHPVISAVGHEIDFTIADFVADYRAPTPSAAAEIVCANVVELKDRIDSMENALVRVMEHRLAEMRQTVDHLRKQLLDPKKQLSDYRARCMDLKRRLKLGIQRRPRDLREKIADRNRRMKQGILRLLKDKKQQLVSQGALLDSLSPLKVVERGYSIVKIGDEVVKASSQIKKGDPIVLRFATGGAEATIEKVLEKQEV